VGSCAYQKVNLPANPHIPARDLNGVRLFNSSRRQRADATI
jgi:hypothetical protein